MTGKSLVGSGSVLLRLLHAWESGGALIKMQILTQQMGWSLRFCISDKPPILMTVHPNECGVVSYCGFDLDFSEGEHFFMCLTSYLCIFWGRNVNGSPLPQLRYGMVSCTWKNVHHHWPVRKYKLRHNEVPPCAHPDSWKEKHLMLPSFDKNVENVDLQVSC